MFLEIAFPIPLNRTFTYMAPEQSAVNVVGRRVTAPFGNKTAVGYVVGVNRDAPSFPTKAVTSWMDEEPFIDETLLALARWVSERYLCSLGEALACMVPVNLKAPKRRCLTPRSVIPEVVIGPNPLKGIGRDRPVFWDGDPSRRDFFIDGSPLTTRGDDSKEKTVFELTTEQIAAMAHFNQAVDSRQFNPFVLRGITDSGKTELYMRAIDRALAQKRQALYLLPEIVMTPPFFEQLKLRYGSEKVALWHSGVTMTQRFNIWKGLKDGTISILLGARSAVFAPFKDLGLIVVDEEHEPSYKQEDRPRYHAREVALERARCCDAVVIMGSATPSLESYCKAKRGEYSLVELTSRVESRELPEVILIDRRPLNVSSPPSQPSPSRGEGRRRRGMPFSIFSENLKLAMENRLARREQIMLFVNRRGFTPFLRCPACGWVARCNRCSLTLSLHMAGDKKHPLVKTKSGVLPVPADAELRCHTCSRSEPVPIQCPSCKKMRLHQFGVGTQRVEEEIKALFPFIKMARLDRDLSGTRHAYQKIYQAFKNKELDMLVGTQIIAKGFDFPAVTLVGVIDADVNLYLPDFRSAERTFQLIAQVAGRAGRGESGGKVLVQTHHAEHPALQYAKSHDFVRFFEEEIKNREELNYPPFCRLVNIIIKASTEAKAEAAAEALAEKLRVFSSPLEGEDVGGGAEKVEIAPHPHLPPQGGKELSKCIDLLGPVPAPYSRIRNQYRYQVILKGDDASLKSCLDYLRTYKPAKAYMIVDVDPVDLL
jgi:primosomal protein N' (replication factor Y)